MYMYTIYVDTMHKHTRFFHDVLGLPHTKDVLGPLVFYLVKLLDVSFSCVVKTQIRWSNKIYKTELTKTRYNNQVLGKYRVDPQRAGLTLIAELTWSNLGLKQVLNKRK